MDPSLSSRSSKSQSTTLMGDPCAAVEAELVTLSHKLSRFNEKSGKEMEEAIDAITNAKLKLSQMLSKDGCDEGDRSSLSLSEARSVLSTSLSHCSSLVSAVSSDHRELHTSVSKVGKTIERGFVADYDAVARKEAFEGSRQQRRIDQVVLTHLYRQAYLDIGDTLAQEAGLVEQQGEEDEVVACDHMDDISIDDEKENKGNDSSKLHRHSFVELNAIIDALNRRDLRPALEWAVLHREALNNSNGGMRMVMNLENSNLESNLNRPSSLEMKLHRLHFIQLLSSAKASEAVQYARAHFSGFERGFNELQQLMGAVVFSNRLQSSPYAYLLKDDLWIEVQDEFVKDACSLMGLPVESPLTVVLNAGCKALPALLNIKQVMQQQRQTAGVWCVKDELPIEIELGREAHFHSIFACPILRQQTSEFNPPLRLTCGHCISKDALAKLSTGHKIKCPYCPVEQNPNDARQITF